jgi:hypothetical protein
MTPQPTEFRSSLRWRFRHGKRSLNCLLSSNAVGDYDVCVLPHWNLPASTIETFDNGSDAFERYAQIAMMLQSEGWRVDQRTSRSAAA